MLKTGSGVARGRKIEITIPTMLNYSPEVTISR